MPKDLFGDVVEPSIKVGSQAWYTVPVSIFLHVLLVGGVIIVPLLAADVLPVPPTMMAFVAAAPPPPPPPPPPPLNGCDVITPGAPGLGAGGVLGLKSM